MTLQKAIEAEVWRSIFYKETAYPYEISNHGRVRNKSGLILRPGFSCGYPAVCLSKNGRERTVRVHRLVGTHFLDGDHSKTINHIDGNRKNSHVSNLEWVSMAENMRHSVTTGLTMKKAGEKNCNAKLKDSEIHVILEKSKTMKILHIAKEYGVGWNTIQRIIKGESYRAGRDANVLYVEEK